MKSSSCPGCGSEIPEGRPSPCPRCAATEAGPVDGSTAGEIPREIAGFRIVREIGSGGMGTVYEADDPRMRRRVALKVLSRHLAPGKASTRFDREAWIGGRLSHPGLVRVFERGTHEDVQYFSMELVDGGSLDDVLKRLRKHGRDEAWDLVQGSREHLEWVLSRIIEVARALDHAHRQGVVHRDIKPANVLLSREPFSVKIADFGLAVEEDTTRLTTAGTVLGTVCYMAPEQLRGASGEIGVRADVYALGVTLFELLTLELPFAGTSQHAFIQNVLSTESRRPRKLNQRVGRDLEIVIRKALEKAPRDRYESAAALADDLERVLHYRPIQAVPPTPWKRLRQYARRKPVHAALIALLVLGTPTLGLVGFRMIQQQQVLEQQAIEDLIERARDHQLMGTHRMAIDLFAEALERAPERLELLADRARAEFELALQLDGNVRRELAGQALDHLSRFIDRRPTLSWPYLLRAYMLRKEERPEEAARDMERAALHRADPPSTDDLLMGGLVAGLDGDYAHARSLFSELVGRAPENGNAYIHRAQATRWLADEEPDFDEFLRLRQEVINDLRIAVGHLPDDFFPRYHLGQLYSESREWEEAIRFFEGAAERDPESPYPWEGLAALYVDRALSEDDLEDLNRAEKAARDALALDPDLASARLNLVAALLERKRAGHGSPANDQTIIEQLTQVIDLYIAGRGVPADHVAALANLCDFYLLDESLGRALDVCQRAVTADPTDAVNHYNLAGAYALHGDHEKALASLEDDFHAGDRDWEYLAEDEWFDALRDDPRFQELLRRMREPEE